MDKTIEFKSIGNTDYLIYTDGRVFSQKTSIFLKHQDNGSGYKKVSLRHGGRTIQKYVHRLVAEAFIENPGELPMVDHIDRNRSNNNIFNLIWVSAAENQNIPTKRYTVKRNCVHRSKKVKTKAISLSKEGYSTVYIGKLLKVPRQTVYSWIYKN